MRRRRLCGRPFIALQGAVFAFQVRKVRSRIFESSLSDPAKPMAYTKALIC